MQFGVVFPQTEIGADPGAVRDYVQAAEELGYSHLIAYDHVLGADTRFYQGWTGGYTSKDMFYEPIVLFGYLAGLTRHLELVTASSSCPSDRPLWWPSRRPRWMCLVGGACGWE
jgi:alkanesulfonate monooxygenase SsuD/methylene tetrahydromethanopterin reductase-like flavin-dependent oxidoreductase (luciferase family)